MDFALSEDAETTLDRFEHGDPTAYELVIDDLELLNALGIDAVSLGTMFGQWVRITGPTGRVSYWLTPIDNDRWLIESIDVE